MMMSRYSLSHVISFVDDLLSGARSLGEACRLQDSLIVVLNESGFLYANGHQRNQRYFNDYPKTYTKAVKAIF